MCNTLQSNLTCQPPIIHGFHIEPSQHRVFQFIGAFIDGQVKQGRAVDEVIAEGIRRDGHDLWFNRDFLSPYSAAVAALARQ